MILDKSLLTAFRPFSCRSKRRANLSSAGRIKVVVEILPMMEMAKDPKGGRRLSTGIAYFEGEVYNVLRHGRSSPPVPLLIIGIAP